MSVLPLNINFIILKNSYEGHAMFLMCMFKLFFSVKMDLSSSTSGSILPYNFDQFEDEVSKGSADIGVNSR
jgi:hypothetical protein